MGSQVPNTEVIEVPAFEPPRTSKIWLIYHSSQILIILWKEFFFAGPNSHAPITTKFMSSFQPWNYEEEEEEEERWSLKEAGLNKVFVRKTSLATSHGHGIGCETLFFFFLFLFFGDKTPTWQCQSTRGS